MHPGEVWVDKQEHLEQDASPDAIRLLQYLDNDEWLVEVGIWDAEARAFISDREFWCPSIMDKDQDGDLYDEDDLEEVLTGQEIFKDYVRVK